MVIFIIGAKELHNEKLNREIERERNTAFVTGAVDKYRSERAEKLKAMQAEITQKLLKKRVGKIYDVLVEEIVQNLEGTDEGLAIGRAWFEAPEVDGNVVIRYDLDDKDAVKNIVPGKVVKVKAVAASEVDIDGFYLG